MVFNKKLEIIINCTGFNKNVKISLKKHCFCSKQGENSVYLFVWVFNQKIKKNIILNLSSCYL